MAASGGNSSASTEPRYLDELEFEKPEYREAIAKKSARALTKPELRAENNWFLSLYEEEFRKKIIPKLEIKWINHSIGKGVFAKENIPELTYLGEYAGIVRKRPFIRPQYNNYIFGYTIAQKDTRYMIDAQDQGNAIRYINHSDHPNICSHWMIIDGICHIILHTIRPVLAGTQLTYDYGPLYWRQRTPPREL